MKILSTKYIIIVKFIPTIIICFYIFFYSVLTLIVGAASFTGWISINEPCGDKIYRKAEVIEIGQQLVDHGAIVDTVKFRDSNRRNMSYIKSSFSSDDLTIYFYINFDTPEYNYVQLYKIVDNATNSEIMGWTNSYIFDKYSFSLVKPIISPIRLYLLQKALYERVLQHINIDYPQSFKNNWFSSATYAFLYYSYCITFLPLNIVLIFILIYCHYFKKLYAINIKSVLKKSGIDSIFKLMRIWTKLFNILPSIIQAKFLVVKYSDSQTRIDFWLDERMNLRTNGTGIEFIGFREEQIIQGVSFRNKEIYFHIRRREYLSSKTCEIFTQLYQPSKDDINEVPNLVSILTYNNSQNSVLFFSHFWDS